MSGIERERRGISEQKGETKMEDKYGDKKKCIDFVFAIICRPLNEADQIIIKLFS